MYVIRKHSSTSNILRATLRNSSTGQGLTGLSSASTGLVIGTVCDNEATAVAYTVAGNTIESIATLGTYAAPTATKIRFKEVDATNHPGLYEIQVADARFAVASAKVLRITFSGATSLLSKDLIVQLESAPADVTHAAGAAITAAAGIPEVKVQSIADNAVSSSAIANGALTAAKFAAGAFDAVWSAATRTLTAISDSSGVTTLLTRLSELWAAQLDTLAGRSDPAANVTAIKTVTDKLDTTLEVDGGVSRFTTNALEQAPTGGGLTAQQMRDALKLAPSAGAPAAGSIDERLWTDTEKAQQRHRLGIDGAAATPTALPSMLVEQVTVDEYDGATTISAKLALENILRKSFRDKYIALDIGVDSAPLPVTVEILSGTAPPAGTTITEAFPGGSTCGVTERVDTQIADGVGGWTAPEGWVAASHGLLLIYYNDAGGVVWEGGTWRVTWHGRNAQTVTHLLNVPGHDGSTSMSVLFLRDGSAVSAADPHGVLSGPVMNESAWRSILGLTGIATKLRNLLLRS